MWTARCNPADRDGNPVRSMYASNVATSSSDKLTLSFTPLCYQGGSQVATIGIRPASTGDWSSFLGALWPTADRIRRAPPISPGTD